MGALGLHVQWSGRSHQSRRKTCAVRFLARQALRGIEKRLKPGGKYEMATIELHDGDELEPAVVRRLVKKALTLNESLGDPTHVDT